MSGTATGIKLNLSRNAKQNKKLLIDLAATSQEQQIINLLKQQEPGLSSRNFEEISIVMLN